MPSLSTIFPALGPRRVQPASSGVVLSHRCDAVEARARTRAGLEKLAQKLRRRFMWSQAARLQRLVLRNAVACTLCAVATNGIFYQGNIFSGRSSSHQTRGEFLVATLTWCSLLYCVMLLVAHVPSMMAQRFFLTPETPPSFWFCAKKFAVGTWSYFLLTIGFMSGMGLLVTRTSLSTQIRLYKLQFYFGILCNHIYTTGLTLVARRIYYQETCQGRGRHHVAKPTAMAQSRRRVTSPLDQGFVPYRSSGFVRMYMRHMPKALGVMLAGGYIHVVSQQRFLEQGSLAVALFMAVSVLFKLAVQKGARQYVVRKKVCSSRTMCVIVGIPTVLIDTQARIVLLGSQSSVTAATGTLLMVFVEICIRVAKAAFVMWVINRRAKTLEQAEEQAGELQRNHRGPLSAERLEFQFWRRQTLAHHTAELTADMYAEYIAIGCSQSILFWYGGHEHYPALALGGGTTLASVSAAELWRYTQVALLGFQFVVEIAVDYVSVVLEIAAGVEFDYIPDLDTFLGVLFMTTALLNIQISATIYIN